MTETPATSTPESAPGWTWMLLVAVVLILLGYGYYSGDKTSSSPTPTAPKAAVPAAKQVLQLPDCKTPCTMKIAEVRDIYTDGEPVYMLPPGWPEEKAIRYSGKGHIVIQGGNIRSGRWEFWSADDPSKVVLVRVFGR